MKIYEEIKNKHKSRYAFLMQHIILLLSITILFSCGDADMNSPIGKGDGVPQPVTVTGIENVSGGAIVKYNLPNDDNVNYIEAVYYIKGVKTTKKGSFYTNELELDGFPEVGEYNVSLYSVSFSEVRSEPVEVTVYPTTPPFLTVAETLDVEPVFGGVKSTYRNPTGANLQLVFYKQNDGGIWEELETLYTSLKEGVFYVRGLESVETTFGVVCRDRWQNVSDTLEIQATPIYEEMADRTLFANLPLPGDITYDLPNRTPPAQPYHTGAGSGVGNIHALWSGNTTQPFSGTNPYFFFSNTSASLPQSITIDLGREYEMSRFVYFPRQVRNSSNPPAHTFAATHVKRFELWGSNNPNPDGSWASWTLIGSFDSVRPSGNPIPGDENSTPEDRLVTTNGENFDMPEGIEPYRYVRYRVFSTWGNQPYWASLQFQFFGNPVE